MSAPRRPLTVGVLAAVLTIWPGPIHAAAKRKVAPPTPCPWAGIYPTVLTPFCADGVDTASLERQLRYELQGGVHGLLVLGTIGEGEYVSMKDRALVIATAVQVAADCVPVVVGIHTCDLDLAREQVVQARALGAAAVLVKYIGNPKAPAAQVLGFLAALSELNALPIFYYHYPSQTKLKLGPKDVAAILGLPGVVGIKESTLDLREVQAHLSLACGLGKVFLTGTALNLTQFMDLGGHGAMCPEAVLLPGPTVQMYRAYIHGRHDEARSLQKCLFAMAPILRSGPTPPAVARVLLMTAQDHKVPVPMGDDHPQARLKAALTDLGVPTAPLVKCPLPPLTGRDRQRVHDAVRRLTAIDWCEAVLKVPPAPLHSCSGEAGEMRPRISPFQLGPVGPRGLLLWQGDGEGGIR